MSAAMTTEQLRYELEYFFSLADRRYVELTAEKVRSSELVEQVERLQEDNERLSSDLRHYFELSASLSKKLSEVIENESATVARSVDMDQRLKRATDVYAELLSEDVVLRKQAASLETLVAQLQNRTEQLMSDLRSYQDLKRT